MAITLKIKNFRMEQSEKVGTFCVRYKINFNLWEDLGSTGF